MLEHLDAFLGEKDDRGRIISSERGALVAVVATAEHLAHLLAADRYPTGGC